MLQLLSALAACDVRRRVFLGKQAHIIYTSNRSTSSIRTETDFERNGIHWWHESVVFICTSGAGGDSEQSKVQAKSAPPGIPARRLIQFPWFASALILHRSNVPTLRVSRRCIIVFLLSCVAVVKVQRVVSSESSLGRIFFARDRYHGDAVEHAVITSILFHEALSRSAEICQILPASNIVFRMVIVLLIGIIRFYDHL